MTTAHMKEEFIAIAQNQGAEGSMKTRAKKPITKLTNHKDNNKEDTRHKTEAKKRVNTAHVKQGSLLPHIRKECKANMMTGAKGSMTKLTNCKDNNKEDTRHKTEAKKEDKHCTREGGFVTTPLKKRV